jgi:hypothetical protein
VTRSGAPGSGLRIDASGSKGTMFFGGMPQGAPPAPTTGPQRMTATTREDGSFEMLVDEPGQYGLNAMTTDGRVRLPTRTVEVPDTDAYTVELSFDGAPLGGIVVDQETEAPVPYANVSARPKEQQKGFTGGLAGPDGRFQLEVEPGEYSVGASARDGGYGSTEQKVTVGEGGLADVKLALPKGLAISGKVTDATGRPAAGASVRAMCRATRAPATAGRRRWPTARSR